MNLERKNKKLLEEHLKNSIKLADTQIRVIQLIREAHEKTLRELYKTW